MPATATLKHLLSLPNLPQILAQAQQHLEEEKRRRQQFYDDIDESVKAEFIQGEMVLHSPVSRKHNLVRMGLSNLMRVFSLLFRRGEVHDEKAMVHLTRNSFEPDIAFWRSSVVSTFADNQMLFPAPDWAVEVLSKSTEKYDRKLKFEDYALHGVQEYWIIDPDRETVEQYILPEGGDRYELRRKAGVGDEIESMTLTGFRIPVQAIFDEEANREALRRLSGQ